jgi:hypothetical protein
MDDEIPEQRWARELNIIKRAGFAGWQEFLRRKHG